MRALLRPRGVTLLELMVAMTVTAVVIAGSVVVVNSQQKAYVDGMRLRSAQSSARRALLAVEQTVPLAAFGLDAPLALDLQGWTGGPCPSTMNGCARDSTSTSDELVFFARDPRYWVPDDPAVDPVGNAWRISQVTSSTVTFLARKGDQFRRGQIFLAVCPNSANYALFTSSETEPVGLPLTNDQSLSITLEGVNTANPFRRQDVAAPFNSCFNLGPPTSPARLFLVNRYRFHVRPAVLGSAIGGTTVYDPLLVLDRGVDMDLDGDVDQDDEEIVAEGIESMQVAYGFNAGLAQAGTAAGTAVTFTANTAVAAGTTAEAVTTTLFPGATPPSGKTAYFVSSFYPYTFGPPPAGERQTNHQANVQSLRIAVLARSLETDTRTSTRIGGFLPLLNQDAAPSWVTAYEAALGGHDGYQRVVLETSVVLPNMATRAMTYF